MQSQSLSPSPAQRELDRFLHGSRREGSPTSTGNTTQATHQRPEDEADEEVTLPDRPQHAPASCTTGEKLEELDCEQVSRLLEAHRAGPKACQEILDRQINGLTFV